MKDIFLQYGFKYEGSCHCDGYQSDKYRKGNYQVRHRVKRREFKVKKDGRTITQWITENKLIETLETIQISTIAVPA